MNETNPSKRSTLIRNSVVFQLKLMADGFRDLVLLPVSLIATLIGLLRGGDEPEREFLQVINIGRETEQWINLFGNHELPENAHAIASIDALFSKVEKTLKQQYLAAGTSARAQAEIDEALQMAHDKAREQQSGE
ncbi:MAG: hypothetical protein QNK22_06025 [Xanthomonadales bacterium]|nr:hypothetical protein [Xanthomonadales bacterium]